MLDKEFQLIPYKVKSIYDKPDEHIPWGVSSIGAPFLWEKYGKGKGIVQAIIDTGADYRHEDLKDRIAGGKDFTGSGDFDDKNGHGTHVSGSAAASDNGKGIVGVAPESEILALKALGDDGMGSLLWTMEAMRYAIDQEVHIINMSLGGPHHPLLHELVQEANDKGIFVVAASGNEGDGLIFTPEISFPGYYEESVQVGAVDYYGRLAYFTNTNSNLDVLAPGVNILSTYPGNRYAVLDGTSMATPHVSGAIALALSNGGLKINKKSNEVLNLKREE